MVSAQVLLAARALAGAPGRGEGFILGDVGPAVWVQVCKK